MKKVSEFINSKQANLKTATMVTRIPNFNKESDVFVFLIEKLEKNQSIASKILNKAWDMVSTGKFSNAQHVIMDDARKFVDKNWDDVTDYVIEKVDRFMQVDDPKFKEMTTKVFVVGIVNELKENPNDYTKFLSNQAKKEVDDFVVNRGKEKFTTIIENRRK